MKDLFVKTLNQLKTSSTIQFIDRDRGQIDRYDQRPAVKFPCALISISIPKRKNLAPTLQICEAVVKIRLAFDRLADSNNLSDANRLNLALAYYNGVEEIEALFQGWGDNEMNRWECISTVDEERPDFDIVTLTFKTGFKKSI